MSDKINKMWHMVIIKKVNRLGGGVHVISLPTKKQQLNHLVSPKIKAIVINFSNLSEKEQVRLFFNLGEFSMKQLPSKKILYIFTIKKKPTPFIASKACGMSSLQSNENTAGKGEVK
jgi:hypothetical protein